MANIGEIIKEWNVEPLDVPVEAPEHSEPSRVGEEAPDRELVPAGA